MPSPPASLTTLLAELAASGVEFILVGGLAAVAQGAPVTTHDIDIVPHRTADNIEVLCRFLRTHSARYLDVLGAIEGGRDYAALIPHAIELDLDGHLLRVLSLAMLTELKRLSTHPKDKLMLAILEAMIREPT